MRKEKDQTLYRVWSWKPIPEKRVPADLPGVSRDLADGEIAAVLAAGHEADNRHAEKSVWGYATAVNSTGEVGTIEPTDIYIAAVAEFGAPRSTILRC